MRKLKTKRKALHDYEFELTTAFTRDCENLLEEFDKHKTHSFEAFSNVWKAANFTLVYSNYSSPVFLKEFIEIAFFTAKKFILFPKNLFTQIGAFYILYGMYYKQPLKAWVKIRLTLDEFKKIEELVNATKHSCLDVAFIFAKLVYDNAFMYTSTLKPKGFEFRYLRSTYEYENDTFLQNSSDSVYKSVDKLLASDFIKSFEKTMKEYEDAKKECPVECRGIVPSEIDMMQELEKLRPSKCVDPQDRAAANEEEEESIVVRRRRLKRKTLMAEAQNYRQSKVSNITESRSCVNEEPSTSGGKREFKTRQFERLEEDLFGGDNADEPDDWNNEAFDDDVCSEDENKMEIKPDIHL